MRVLPLLPILLSSWFIAPAQADDAQDWLNRLGLAAQQQSYQGTFVYERNGSFSTHSIWHRVEDGKIRERLLQLDGVAQEVVRVDGRTQCISGKLASGLGDVADAAARKFDVEKLKAWYDIAVVGDSRVAGRPAVVVALTPRDPHRYGVELHLDRETGLPLKSLLLNDKGQLLERFQFTRLETVEPDAGQLKASSQCEPIVASNGQDQTGQGDLAWHSDWLPPGFELTSSSVHRDPRANSDVTSLLYDDGLARFSVFLEPLKGMAAADARLQLGPTVAVSRRLTTPEGEIMVTVVGEIPMGTAERIALSMRSGSSGADAKPQ